MLSGDVGNVLTFSEGGCSGAVKRPMVYELIGGETAADAIAMAGSFSRSAFLTSTPSPVNPASWACPQPAPWI